MGPLRLQQVWQAGMRRAHLGGVLVVNHRCRALARQGQQLAANGVCGRSKAVPQICSHLHRHNLYEKHSCIVPATLRGRQLQLSGDDFVYVLYVHLTCKANKRAWRPERRHRMHSNGQCYCRKRSWGKGKEYCVGDLRSHLHGVKVGQRPGRGDMDGWCRGSCRESAQMEASLGVLNLQAQLSEIYEARIWPSPLVNSQ